MLDPLCSLLKEGCLLRPYSREWLVWVALVPSGSYKYPSRSAHSTSPTYTCHLKSIPISHLSRGLYGCPGNKPCFQSSPWPAICSVLHLPVICHLIYRFGMNTKFQFLMIQLHTGRHPVPKLPVTLFPESPTPRSPPLLSGPSQAAPPPTLLRASPDSQISIILHLSCLAAGLDVSAVIFSRT